MNFKELSVYTVEISRKKPIDQSQSNVRRIVDYD